MLTVVCWSWNRTFGPEYVNHMRSMLQRHLKLKHELVCVTSEPEGIDPRVRVVPAPAYLAGTPRCRRRMWNFAKERATDLGERLLCVDLDMVITDEITSMVDRPEPLVCWKVGYAKVYTGALTMFDAGVLDALWQAYNRDREGFPRLTGERNASETAMLTHWIRSRGVKVAEWTERDGLVMWFGKGYEDREHHGIGPSNPNPPKGTKIVMLGGADKYLMDERRYEWVRANWQ